MRAKFLLFRISSVGMNDALLMRKSVVRAHDAEPNFCDDRAPAKHSSLTVNCMLKSRLEDSESYAKFKMVAVTICFSAMTM